MAHKYLQLDNTDAAAVKSLACLCKDKPERGKWIVRYVPEYGELRETLKLVLLAQALDSPVCNVLFVPSGTSVWIHCGDDEDVEIHRKKPDDATDENTKVLKMHSHDKLNLSTEFGILSHGGFHIVCECPGGDWVECGNGGPAECCS